MSGTVRLGPGTWLSLDGGAVEVVSLAGATVTVRDAAGRWQAIGTAVLLARAFPLDVPETAPPSAGLLAGLDVGQREAVSERAGHVREMLTGYRSDTSWPPSARHAGSSGAAPSSSSSTPGSRPQRSPAAPPGGSNFARMSGGGVAAPRLTA